MFIIADKANRDKKGARSATFPKMLAWFDIKTHRVMKIVVDYDAAGSTSVNAATAIENPLQKFKSLVDIKVAR